MSPSLTRRNFLRTGSVAGATLLLGGCGLRETPPAPSPLRRVRPLAPVHVRESRVIRTVAGIRPYRPAGFVVRSAQLGDRTIVHNYGHGGGGISLAWGSSELAVEFAGEVATEREFQDFGVLGCGIMGLTTARLLQDRGYRVTIYARDLPPHTTSNVGGGQWSPYTVFQVGETSPSFDVQYERAARLSHSRYQTMVGSRYGVRWIENYILRAQPSSRRNGPISDLFYQVEEFGPGEHPFPAPWVERRTTMLIEPNTFLPAVTEDFLLRGGRIVPRTFDSTVEILALEEEGIVNCTGIGSRSLFGDFDLTPIKGQLAILLPQPEVDYIAVAGGAYMFPRTDGIVLGGSQERGEWSTTPTPEVQGRILEGNRSIFEGMAPPGHTSGFGEGV